MSLPIAVIVGGGQAGTHTAISLRQYGYLGRIVLIGEEPELPYHRPPLTKDFLAGEIQRDRLTIKERTSFDRIGIEIRLGARATTLRVRDRTLLLDNGETLAFDHLVLAMGSRPKAPKIAGSEHGRVHQLHTIGDAISFRDQMQKSRRLAVVGGGYVGLETAAVIRQNGAEVIVIESGDHLMNRVTGPVVGGFYAGLHRERGVEVLLGTRIHRIEGAPEAPRLVLADRSVIDVDMVLAGVGSAPNVELAVEAGIVCNDGIVVDEYCQTSVPDIYAAGDCAEQRSTIYNRQIRLESVPNALDQARRVAAGICHRPDSSPYVPWFWTDQYDVKLQTAGLRQGHDQLVIRGEVERRSFAVFYLKDQRLLAVDAVNRSAEFALARAWIAEGTMLNVEGLADDSAPAHLVAA